MQNEPIEPVGSLQEQLTSAALLAAEVFMDKAGLSYKGYDAGQINDMLIEDLKEGVKRNAVQEALVVFGGELPADVPALTGDALRNTLIKALEKCNELGLG